MAINEIFFGIDESRNIQITRPRIIALCISRERKDADPLSNVRATIKARNNFPPKNILEYPFVYKVVQDCPSGNLPIGWTRKLIAAASSKFCIADERIIVICDVCHKPDTDKEIGNVAEIRYIENADLRIPLVNRADFLASFARKYHDPKIDKNNHVAYLRKFYENLDQIMQGARVE